MNVQKNSKEDGLVLLVSGLDGYGPYRDDIKKQVNRSIHDNQRLDNDQIAF
jgi:hypothetical protein